MSVLPLIFLLFAGGVLGQDDQLLLVNMFQTIYSKFSAMEKKLTATSEAVIKLGKEMEMMKTTLNEAIENVVSKSNRDLATMGGKIDEKINTVVEEVNKTNAAMDLKFTQMEAKMNQILENKESKYIGAINSTNVRIEGYSGKLDEIYKERVASTAAPFREEISRYNNTRIGNFMSLLLYTMRLKSSPYWDTLEVTGLRNNLPDSIKTITTSNFCIKGYNRYIFAFDNSHFDAPVANQRIGALRYGSKPRTGAEWTIEASEDGESVYLKNVYRGQYLYAKEALFGTDSSYRETFFGGKENSDRFKWMILPTDSNANYFYVKNVRQNTRIEQACAHSTSSTYTVCTSFTSDNGDQHWVFERC
jgi:hypothetical protein